MPAAVSLFVRVGDAVWSNVPDALPGAHAGGDLHAVGAILALRGVGQPDLALAAVRRLFERQLQPRLVIGAGRAPRPGLAALRGACAAEQHVEERAEAAAAEIEASEASLPTALTEVEPELLEPRRRQLNQLDFGQCSADAHRDHPHFDGHSHGLRSDARRSRDLRLQLLHHSDPWRRGPAWPGGSCRRSPSPRLITPRRSRADRAPAEAAGAFVFGGGTTAVGGPVRQRHRNRPLTAGARPGKLAPSRSDARVESLIRLQ